MQLVAAYAPAETVPVPAPIRFDVDPAIGKVLASIGRFVRD